jgi:hypothetical protein
MSDVQHPQDYEKSDADPRLIGALALGLAVFLIATPCLLLAAYPGVARLGGISPNLPLPPAPRLQVDPKADLEQMRSYEHGRLQTYGWTDRGSQVTRIPIGRAMQLLAERGLAGWPSSPAGEPPR